MVQLIDLTLFHCGFNLNTVYFSLLFFMLKKILFNLRFDKSFNEYCEKVTHKENYLHSM